MHASQHTDIPRGESLLGEVLSFRGKLVELKNALFKARREKAELVEENESLKRELACRPSVLGMDLESLRKGIVFQCHPDRGGDTKLLQRILELFNRLQRGRVG